MESKRTARPNGPPNGRPYPPGVRMNPHVPSMPFGMGGPTIGAVRMTVVSTEGMGPLFDENMMPPLVVQPMEEPYPRQARPNPAQHPMEPKFEPGENPAQAHQTAAAPTPNPNVRGPIGPRPGRRPPPRGAAPVYPSRPMPAPGPAAARPPVESPRPDPLSTHPHVTPRSSERPVSPQRPASSQSQVSAPQVESQPVQVKSVHTSPTLKRNAVPERYSGLQGVLRSREDAIFEMRSESQKSSFRVLFDQVFTRSQLQAELHRFWTQLAGKTADEQLWEVRPPKGGFTNPTVRAWVERTLEAAGYEAAVMFVEWEIHWRRRGF